MVNLSTVVLGEPPPEHVEPGECVLRRELALERVLGPAPVSVTGDGVSLDGHLRLRASHVEGDPGHKVSFLQGSFGKVVHRLLALPAGVLRTGRWTPAQVHLPATKEHACTVRTNHH
jgi:hypothetical protein